MVRYFLHIKDREDVLRDPEGQELVDLAAAKTEAAAVARDLMAECLRAGAPLGLHRQMLIADTQDVPVASVSFAEALPPENFSARKTIL
jgi:hypothetical protein